MVPLLLKVLKSGVNQTTDQPSAVHEEEQTKARGEIASHEGHNLANNDSIIRNYSGCKAYFGPGAIVQRLITAFESKTVAVSNVPADASRLAFIELAESFGEVKSITYDGTSARIEYTDVADAAYAVEGLSDRELGQFTLSARFDLRAVAVGPATLRSTKVRVSWYAPSTVAWVSLTVLPISRFRLRVVQAE